MGGSQVYLEENETMSLHEMFKCMAIGSANDFHSGLLENTSQGQMMLLLK